MVDDVPANLAPFLVDEIFDIVCKINTETKVAVLLVEQNVAAALEIAHSAYLVENGRIVMNGTAEVAVQSRHRCCLSCGGNRTDYHAVKHYCRRRRWLA